MSQVCQVCSHSQRLEIDREIISGVPHTKIGLKYGISNMVVRNHAANHLSRQLSKAYQMKEAAESMDLLSRIEDILMKAQKIFDRNYAKEKDGLALKALGEQRSTIELLAKIAAFLHESRAAELQATQNNDDEESRKRLSFLTFDELVILESLNKKMNKADQNAVDTKISIPYTYIGRKDRARIELEDEPVPEQETEPVPEQETEPVPEQETEPEPEPEATEPVMTRTALPKAKRNPLAIEPDLSSPRTKLPRNPRHWIRY